MKSIITHNDRNCECRVLKHHSGVVLQLETITAVVIVLHRKDEKNLLRENFINDEKQQRP